MSASTQEIPDVRESPAAPVISGSVVVVQVEVARPPAPGVPLAMRIRLASQAAVVLVFLFALLAPTYGFLFRTPPPSDENRELAKFPTLLFKKYSIKGFPKWFDIYFSDHVGYRDVLLNGYRRVMNRVFAESSSPRAWVGEEGWVYLNVDDPDRYLSGAPSVDEKLEAWAEVLADRQAYLAAQGIEYVVVIAPEKSSVYPEHLPVRRRQNPPPEPSAAMVKKLQIRGVRSVNLLPAVLAARDTHDRPLYYKTDSHWNPDGARAGYRALAKELSAALPGFIPEPDSRYAMYEDTGGGDLWKFVGPPDSFVPEPCRRYPARDLPITETVPAFHDLLDPEDRRPHLPLRCYETQAAGPRMLLLRDSFATDMLPCLTADFSRVTAVPSHRFPLIALQAEKPRIVVQEFVARFLYLEKAWNPSDVAGFRKRVGK